MTADARRAPKSGEIGRRRRGRLVFSGRTRLRALLIIFGTLAVLIFGFALAIATGWLRLAHVDPFAHAASTTQPVTVPEPDDPSSVPNPQSPDPVLADAVERPPAPPERAVV